MKLPLPRKDLAFIFLAAVAAGGILFASHHQAASPQTESHLAADAPAPTPTASTPEKSTDATVSEADKRNGITRVKTPEGGLLVQSPKPPRTRLDPHDLPGYTPGDWYVDNLSSEPAVITPFIEKDAYGSDVQAPVIESLLERDRDTFQWQPSMAESYEQKADNVTIVFKIRKEACFSDKQPVTADNVVFSYNTAIAKGIDNDRYKAGLSKVDTVKKIDERTVEFKFKEPFFQELEQAGGLPIIPQHIYKYDNPEAYNKMTDVLVGSGPYKFEKQNWQRGQRLVLVRNENYWAEKPPFDKIVFVFIQNPQASFQAFQNGEIDSIGATPEQWDKFSNDAEFKAKYTIYKYDRPNSGFGYIGWNEKKPLFADAKTRTAMTMLTDRKTMIATIQRNLAHEITGPFSFMTPQCDSSITPIPFDPRAARKLLADAGWKLNAQNVLTRENVEFRFDMMIPADVPQYQQVAEFVKTQYAKAGIIMTIAPFEFSVLVNKLDDRKFDAAMLGWTGSVEEDPYQIWHSDSIKDKGSNYISWSNKEADKLIDAGRREMDETKRMEIWHKLHKIIADDQPYTFLWIRTATIFIQPRFKNTEPDKLGVRSWNWYVPKDQQKYH